MRRCRRTAPKPRLFHFCGMAGWETICERGSSLGFSQNTVFASSPEMFALVIWPGVVCDGEHPGGPAGVPDDQSPDLFALDQELKLKRK